MDGFHYVDLFASKGIEYLLVIGMLLVFVPFWMRLKNPARAVVEAVRRIAPVLREWFRVPKGFFFHQGHAWARPAEGEIVTVGMDEFAQKLVGPVTAVETPVVGQRLVQGDPAWSLRVGDAALPMLSPVDGEVVAVNEAVLGNPAALTGDPFEDAWLLKVRVPGREANLRNLLSGALARRWMDQDQGRLMARMGDETLGTVLQDGGLPVNGMARTLDPSSWEGIVREFFRVA